jgi:hypothetical protein
MHSIVADRGRKPTPRVTDQSHCPTSAIGTAAKFLHREQRITPQEPMPGSGEMT